MKTKVIAAFFGAWILPLSLAADPKTLPIVQEQFWSIAQNGVWIMTGIMFGAFALAFGWRTIRRSPDFQHNRELKRRKKAGTANFY